MEKPEIENIFRKPHIKHETHVTSQTKETRSLEKRWLKQKKETTKPFKVIAPLL